LTENNIENIYIKNIDSKVKEIRKEILSDIHKNTDLKHPEDLLNIILMYSENLLYLNYTYDLNFAFLMDILNDKKVFKIINENLDKFLQSSTMNGVEILIYSILFKHYQNLQFNTLLEDDIIKESLLLSNIGNNLEGDKIDFFKDIITPTLNLFIYSIDKDNTTTNDLFKNNLTSLSEQFKRYKEEKTDFIYISNYINRELKKKGIL